MRIHQEVSEHQVVKGQEGQRVFSIPQGLRVAVSLPYGITHRLQARSRLFHARPCAQPTAWAQILVHTDVGGQHCLVQPAAAAQVSLPHELHLSSRCFGCRAISFIFFSQLYESVLPQPRSMAQHISSSSFESRS